MEPNSAESAGISRRDLFRSRFSQVNVEPSVQDRINSNSFQEAHTLAIARELERMGIRDHDVEVRFLPGDHVLSESNTQLLEGATAVTGELSVDRLTGFALYDKKPDLLEDAIRSKGTGGHDQDIIHNLLQPGVEQLNGPRVRVMQEGYKQLQNSGVRIYSGDISSLGIANLSSRSSLEKANMVSVGAAGLLVLTELGLAKKAIDAMREDTPLTRRKLLKMTGLASLGAVVGSVIKNQALLNYEAIPQKRSPMLETAIDLEESLEHAMRSAGLTSSELDVYSEVYVRHRNNIMALHTWRTIAEESRITQNPHVAVFYGPGHGKTESIFDEGPKKIEAEIEASASRFVTDGLTYLIDKGYGDDVIIHQMILGAGLYPPCFGLGQGQEAEDSIEIDNMPQSAEMVFFGVLQNALETAKAEGDRHRVVLLQGVMTSFISTINNRVALEVGLNDLDDSQVVGEIDESLIAYRSDIPPEPNSNLSQDSYMYRDSQVHTGDDGQMQVGIYNDSDNVYPLVMGAVSMGDGTQLLKEEVIMPRGRLGGREYICRKIDADAFASGHQVVLVAEDNNTAHSLSRQAVYKTPDDKDFLLYYDVYQAEGVISGIENPVILWHKPR